MKSFLLYNNYTVGKFVYNESIWILPRLRGLSAVINVGFELLAEVDRQAKDLKGKNKGGKVRDILQHDL